jgi:hypothetical protein
VVAFVDKGTGARVQAWIDIEACTETQHGMNGQEETAAGCVHVGL